MSKVKNSHFVSACGLYEIYSISNWISVKHKQKVNKKNSLYDYSSEGLNLDYFSFQGHKYALNQFSDLGSTSLYGETGGIKFFDESKNFHTIQKFDLFSKKVYPLYMEYDHHSDRVKLYEVYFTNKGEELFKARTDKFFHVD